MKPRIYGVRRHSEAATALFGRSIRIVPSESAVAASLCRRTPGSGLRSTLPFGARAELIPDKAFFDHETTGTSWKLLELLIGNPKHTPAKQPRHNFSDLPLTIL